MATVEEHYQETITQHARQILSFLRTFEALQEQIHLGKINEHQEELVGKVGDLFPAINSETEKLEIPPNRDVFHKKWLEALEHLEDAYTSFRTGSPHNLLVPNSFETDRNGDRRGDRNGRRAQLCGNQNWRITSSITWRNSFGVATARE